MHHGTLSAIVGMDAHGIEPSVERFQFRLGVNLHSDPARRTMFDMNRNAYRNFTVVTKRLQGMETGSFHQAIGTGRAMPLQDKKQVAEITAATERTPRNLLISS